MNKERCLAKALRHDYRLKDTKSMSTCTYQTKAPNLPCQVESYKRTTKRGFIASLSFKASA